MMNRFDYVKYDSVAQTLQSAFKEQFIKVESMLYCFKDGRSRKLAMDHLETVYMWIGKAIRDEQIERNGTAPLHEERTNG